jgi:acyl-CoA synthetase (AMP-forming)/AMP-acid ligase II
MATMARWDNAAWSASVLAGAGLLRPFLPDQVLGMGLALRRYGLSIASMYAVGAARSSRRAAVIDERGMLTFGEMDDRTSTVAAGLADRGVREGDRVAVLCRNHRGFIEATVGLAKLGADALFLNTGMAGPQLAQVFEREGASAVILDEEFLAATAALGPGVPRILADEVDRVAGGPRRRAPIPAHSGGQIILTSGTTGAPKGAHRGRTGGGLGPLVSLLSAVPLRRGDVTHVPAPLFHAWGFAHMALAGVLGSTLVLGRRFDAEATLQAIEEHQVTVLAVVPVMLQRIMDLPEATRTAYDTSSLRVTVSSGAALPGDLATRFMDAFGDVLYNLYGSTEVAWVSIASPADLRGAPTTAGRPPRGTVVKLLDPKEHEVAPGQRGRIFVGNDLLFSGYTGGGSKPVVDGLMATGDIGHVNDGGLLFVDGRDDDMIVSGGENVFPCEVEDLLLQHGGIAEVCVVGVPDEQWGQRLRACVVVAPGGGDVSADEVRDFVRGRLATYKVPRDVVFLDELPRNATGKILRRQLTA